MERKRSTEYSGVFLGKQKAQVTFKDFIFVVGSVLRTGSAQRLSSQYFAAVPISNIAELVPSGFFCPQPWFLRRSEHIFPRKTPVFTVINTVTRNSRNIKSSRSTTVECAAFGNGLDIKHGRASAFRYFLSTSVGFAADRTHFPKKNTRVYVNQAAINCLSIK